jgi:formylglycine-generating enzyme required for sulfatase activity
MKSEKFKIKLIQFISIVNFLVLTDGSRTLADQILPFDLLETDQLIEVLSHLPTSAIEKMRVNVKTKTFIESCEFYDRVMKKRPIYESLTSSVFRQMALDELETQAGKLRVIHSLLDPNSQFGAVPGGAFKMGSPEAEEHRTSDELQHTVRLAPYSIQKYKVTQLLWYLIESYSKPNKKLSNPSFAGSNDCPKQHWIVFGEVPVCVLNPLQGISWDYVVHEMIPKLKSIGIQVRLPSEAEWERAARGTSPEEPQFYSAIGSYSGENVLLNDVAWYQENSFKNLHPVGTLAPNTLGLYDMLGNAREWVSDWWLDLIDYPEVTVNPTGPQTGTHRVIRGASWACTDDLCRAAFRGALQPSLDEQVMKARRDGGRAYQNDLNKTGVRFVLEN